MNMLTCVEPAPVDFYHEHAKQRDPTLSPEWEPYLYEVIGDHRDRNASLIKITGAVAPLVSRGPNRGRRNWRRMQRDTVREFFFTADDHDLFVDEWERTTDRCKRCFGYGKEVQSVGVSGTTYRKCRRCHGTGERPTDTQEAGR